MINFNGMAIALMSTVLLSACGEDKVETKRDAPSVNMDDAVTAKVAYVSDIEDTSSENGASGKYKLCKVNQPGYESVLMFLYNRDKRQIEYDNKKEAEALTAGKPFKNTWSHVRSATLVETCPSGAAARCDVSNIITSYYVDSPIALANFKKNCALLSDNVWTDNP